MATLAMGQGAAGAPPNPPGPPGPPRPPGGPWRPSGTYIPSEGDDEQSDEDPSPKRRRPARRAWATEIESSRRASSPDRARQSFADTLAAIRPILLEIAQIDSSLSYTSTGSSSIEPTQREQLLDRRASLVRDSRRLRERAGSQVIELIARDPTRLHTPAATIQTQDDSNGLLRVSRDRLWQEFFYHIDEDLRLFFEEEFDSLENLLNRSRRNGLNIAPRNLSLYDIPLTSSTPSRAGNTVSDSFDSRDGNSRGTNLSTLAHEGRPNTSIQDLSNYRFGRRRAILSDTHSVTSDGLSPRSENPEVFSRVPGRRGHRGSVSPLSSDRGRVRRRGPTLSRRLRPSAFLNHDTIRPTAIIRQPQSSPLNMSQDPPVRLDVQREDFASRQSRESLPNAFQGARQRVATSSTVSRSVSVNQNPTNGISSSGTQQHQRGSDANGAGLSPQQFMQTERARRIRDRAIANANRQTELVALNGLRDAHQEEARSSDQSQVPFAIRNFMNGFSLAVHSQHQRHSVTNGSSLPSREFIQRTGQLLSQAQIPHFDDRVELEHRRQAQLSSTNNPSPAFDEAQSSGISRGEPASQSLMNNFSSLALSQDAVASFRTNGNPLRPSLDGFNDIEQSQNSPNGVRSSTRFRVPQLQAPNGRWSPGPSQNAGPSSWTNGRPLDGFDDLYQREAETTSEGEDLARQSRGPTTSKHHSSKFPIRGNRQLFSRLTNTVTLSWGKNLLTNDILSRGDGEVTRMGAGESYRPTARPRSPLRTDSFRGDRDRDRSPRRERARTPPTDSWHRSSRDRSPRRRSRTPPRRDRSPLRDNWRSRPRSPIRARTPPRRYSPRRDDDRRARSPLRRDERRRSRSPYDRDRPAPRTRSPLPRRSPPAGSRASYRTRSRSPERRDDRIPSGPSSANWRRRSPSPPARDSERSSERTSGNTSRRSSPPIHPERLHLTQAATRDSRPRSPPTRDRSPPSQLAYRDRDSARSTPRERSPVRPVAPRSPPRGPAGFRAPTGPSGNRNFTAPSPTVSSSNAPVSMSAHNRSENTGPIVPPSGPRGYVPPARGTYSMRGGRGSFGSDRLSRPDTSSWGAAPASRPAAEVSTRGNAPASRPTQTPSPSIPSGPAASIPTGPSGGIPTGPRAGIPSRPSLQHSSSSYNSRPNLGLSNNSGPRPHPAMANLPQIIPGGRIDPTASGIPSDIAARLKRKEEEAETLREELHAKQEKLRQGLKGWDKLSRDSQSMGLRSELSERHVRMLAGEGVGGAAF